MYLTLTAVQICVVLLTLTATHQQVHDKIGNMTESQLSSFYGLVREGEGNYSSDQKNQIARYISTGMSKGSLYAWSVFVSDKETNRGMLSGWIPSDKYCGSLGTGSTISRTSCGRMSPATAWAGVAAQLSLRRVSQLATRTESRNWSETQSSTAGITWRTEPTT